MFTVTGKLLDTTRESGEFTPDGETQSRTWDFSVLHILVGREVVKVRLPKGVHVHSLVTGEEVSVNVTVPPRTKLTTDLESVGLAESAA